MAAYFPPPAEHDDLIRAALRSIHADHYAADADPHADAESEYAGEKLALAARAFATAVDRLPESEWPIGWGGETDAAAALARVRGVLERLRVDHAHPATDAADLGWRHGLAQAVNWLDEALKEGGE